jgi:hypothetical protein
MQKIFDAGFAAGQEAAEQRLSAREQEFIDSVAARTK